MGKEELGTGGRSAICSINKGSPLKVTSDIQVSFVFDEGLQNVLVTSLSTEMESSVPVAVTAGDLGSVADVLDDVFILPCFGCVHQFLI